MYGHQKRIEWLVLSMKFKSGNPSHLKGTGYTRDQIMKSEREEMGLHEDPRDQILAPIRAVLSLCVKPANRLLSRKSKTREETLDRHHNSPLDSPRRLLTKISNKAVTLKLKKSRKREKEEGVWQKAILMGEKCQPPEFSGVIYYDYDGKQLSEPPMAKSPRASPLPSYYSSRANDGF